jgi:hypothetical protein
LEGNYIVRVLNDNLHFKVNEDEFINVHIEVMLVGLGITMIGAVLSYLIFNKHKENDLCLKVLEFSEKNLAILNGFYVDNLYKNIIQFALRSLPLIKKIDQKIDVTLGKIMKMMIMVSMVVRFLDKYVVDNFLSYLSYTFIFFGKLFNTPNFLKVQKTITLSIFLFLVLFIFLRLFF